MLKKLQTQSFMRNPVPQLTEMRNTGSLVKVSIPILGKVWMTTTQAATAQVLKSSAHFGVRKGDGNVVGLSWWMPRSLKRLTSNMLTSDEPEHTRLRGLVDAAFHRHAVLDMEARISELADEFAQKLFSSRSEADLVMEFARPLPLAVICELLGLPQEDRPKFTKWAEGLTTVKGLFSFLRAIRRLKPLTDYIENRVAEERLNPTAGLIAELVQDACEEEHLTDEELIAMVFLLLFAGHETTTHLISGGVLALLQDRDQLDFLRSDWSRLDLAVEEILRFVSPVQTTKPRYVKQDCEVEGIALQRGEIVMPFLVAANFDPAVFENPQVFDITRKPNRHVEFGTGMHFCLGHQLARFELKAALRALFETWPNLDLATSASELRWHERFGLRSLKRLPVSG